MGDPIEFKEIEIFEEYKNHLRLSGLEESTIESKMWQLIPFFKFTGNYNPCEITKQDVEKFTLAIRKDVKAGKRKQTSENNLLISLRQFVNWKFPGNNYFENIKIKQACYFDNNKKWVTREDVLKMLKVCISQRDRCLLLLLWDSAARVSEIINMNRRDVSFDKYGAIISVDGKTGKRQIRIVDSVPDLQLYINQTNGKASDPLFPSNRSDRLTVRGVQNTLRRLAKRASIQYSVHPHSLRHGRLTELSNSGISEMLLRNFAGWVPNSMTPAIYITPTKKDLDDKLLKLSGVTIEEEEDKPDLTTTHTRTCPRCACQNPFDSKYCSKCSMVLDQQEALNLEKETDTFETEFSKLLAAHPGILETLLKNIKSD